MTSQELNLMRRSVQYFDKNKPINIELVKRAINEATYAPSAHNLQPWRLILLTSEESKNKLFNLAYKQQKILDAPLTILIVGDREGYNESNSAWAEIKSEVSEEQFQKILDSAKNAYGKNIETKIKFAESNASLFAMNLMTILKAYFMDTHAIGGIEYQKAKEAFHLAPSEEIVMAVCVGYKDQSKPLTLRRKRKTYEEIAIEL